MREAGAKKLGADGRSEQGQYRLADTHRQN